MTTRSDQVAVITGANGGLGLEASRALARAGFRVVMACRNPEKGRQARADLLVEVPEADAMVLPLDVAEPGSIREFGRQLAAQVGPLDILINNAGVVLVPLSRNSVGQEIHLATNYLGAFALTGTLLPLFRDDARIVNVGSLAHRFARLDLDDPNWERTPYREWGAYARSKLFLQSFTLELHRRLRAAGSEIVALGAHPGFANTNAGRDSAVLLPESSVRRWLSERLAVRWVPEAAAAVRPILHAALDAGAAGGDYFGPSGWLETRGAPGRARVNPAARDVDAGRRLWSASEEMTGVRYLSVF